MHATSGATKEGHFGIFLLSFFSHHINNLPEGVFLGLLNVGDPTCFLFFLVLFEKNEKCLELPEMARFSTVFQILKYTYKAENTLRKKQENDQGIRFSSSHL